MSSVHKRFLRPLRGLIAGLAFCLLLFSGERSWCQSPSPTPLLSGLSLDLSLKNAPPEFQYELGDPVTLIMVLKNVSGWPVHTRKGFKDKELPEFLLVTDPSGARHALSPEVLALDPPPSLFWNNRPVSEAEALPRGWVRSVTARLDELFPVMKTQPGWYTLESHLPFLRFVWVIQDSTGASFGVEDDERNWAGVVSSNAIQLNIVPPSGANLEVEVLDITSAPPKPLGNVSVKLFSGLLNDPELAVAWNSGTALLTGTTDPAEGVARWNGSCQTEGDYTAVAFYLNQYRAAAFSQLGDSWPAGCSGTIRKTIEFDKPPPRNTFALLGLTSVNIQPKAKVYSGAVGAAEAGGQVTIGEKAQLKEGVALFGDKIQIGSKAVVDDVSYNELTNKGSILGEEVTPLELPLDTNFISLPNITPGKDKVTVKQKQSLTLAAGFYEDATVKPNGTLTLQGGVYHFRNLEMSPNTSLLCEKKCEIRVAGILDIGEKAVVRAKSADTLTSADILIYVEGAGASEPDKTSIHADIGGQSEVLANVCAPNGSLRVKNKAKLVGSFIGRHITVGNDAQVWFDSAF